MLTENSFEKRSRIAYRSLCNTLLTRASFSDVPDPRRGATATPVRKPTGNSPRGHIVYADPKRHVAALWWRQWTKYGIALLLSHLILLRYLDVFNDVFLMATDAMTWLRGVPITTTRISPRTGHAAVADGIGFTRLKQCPCLSPFCMIKDLVLSMYSVECPK